MIDISDRATEREEQDRAHALAEVAWRDPTRGKTVADSAFECRVCGEPIPDERRQAVPGVQTCVDCQTDLERSLQCPT
jgi:phage/conjugal plasmid C-4 type zinc finger TraR family protein